MLSRLKSWQVNEARRDAQMNKNKYLHAFLFCHDSLGSNNVDDFIAWNKDVTKEKMLSFYLFISLYFSIQYKQIRMGKKKHENGLIDMGTRFFLSLP